MLAAALVIVGISSSVAQMGLASSIVYHRGGLFQHPYQRTFWISITCVTLASVPFSWIGSIFLFNARLIDHWQLITALAAFTAVFSTVTNLSQIAHDLKVFNLLRNAVVFTMLAGLLILMAMHPTDTPYSWVLGLQLGSTIFMTCASVAWLLPKLILSVHDAAPRNSVSRLTLLHYAIHQHVTVLIGVFLSNVDKIFIMQVGNPAEVGFYALAYALSRQISMVQDSISISLYSKYAGQEGSILSEMVLRCFRSTFLPMLSLALIASALAPWAIPAVFGPAFDASVLPFTLLAIESVVGAGSWTLAQRFNAGGRPGLVAIRQALSVLPVLIGFFFVPERNVSVFLAGLMLLGSLTRLLVTMLIYPMVLREPFPCLIPARQDIKLAITTMQRRLNAFSSK